MTTIATDGKSIACDGKSCLGSCVTSLTRSKIYKVDNYYVGCSGNIDLIEKYIDYLKGAGDLPIRDVNHDTLMVLFLKKNGVFIAEGPNMSIVRIDKIHAIGSGADFAMGAMCLGASPREAVKVASKYDVYTGGKIREYHI